MRDIKFNFIPGKDTVEVISQELVSEKLIDGTDMVASKIAKHNTFCLLNNLKIFIWF